MKRIMILGAGILQVPAIIKAGEMGLEVVAVDMDKEAPGFKYAGKSLAISTIDIKGVVEAAKEIGIDGVMTLASDLPMRTVAAVAEALGIIGIDTETALRATNKSLMRQCLKVNNVPVPEFIKASSYEEYLGAVKSFGTRFIVKPADNSGSRGVYLVDGGNVDGGNEDIVKKTYAYSKKYSRCGDIIVEEYMTGDEVSVETLSVNGECHVIQITDKLTTGAPNFVETGHSQPSRFSAETAYEIKETAIAAVKAIGITNGPSHTEIMVTAEGPKIVELGARLGGDCITTHLVPLSTGVDMVECCIKIALGETPDYSVKFSRGSAIRYFDSHKGTIEKIDGVEEAEKTDGVCQISFVKNAGDKIDDITSSSDRIGFVIAGADTAADAAARCEEAMKKINIKIKPDR